MATLSNRVAKLEQSFRPLDGVMWEGILLSGITHEQALDMLDHDAEQPNDKPAQSDQQA